MGARPNLAEKANCSVWVAPRKLKNGDSVKEFYPLEIAIVAKPICCRKKKEKHQC
jgi:hypothetical protein